MSFGAAGWDWLSRLKPLRAPVALSERAHAGVGGLLGVLLTAFGMRFCLGAGEHVPLLIAPIGASAVLVFGVPASPLAQPYNVVVGNVVAALIGVTAAHFVPEPYVAGALAVALTIAVTSLLGALHPPAGAVALTAVIGGPAIAGAGYRFALVPVALSSLLLVAAGLVFNNLVHRRYPHVAELPASAHRTADPPPEFRVGFAPEDIDAALNRLGTPLDVEREDLIVLFRHVEQEAHRRLNAIVTCQQIMSRDLVTIAPDDSSDLALARLHEHALRILPVVDSDGFVQGAVDLATVAALPHRPVSELPFVQVEEARESTPIDELFRSFTSGRAREALVVDVHRRLVGIVTQTDLLAVVGRAGPGPLFATRADDSTASAPDQG